MKLSVESSPANSKCIALADMQVNKAPYRFAFPETILLCFLNLINMGPK